MGGAYDTRRSFSLKYEKNAILQLVLGLLVTYIIMHSLYVIVLVLSKDQHNILNGVIVPNVALQPFYDFIYRPWTLITYSLGHLGFFEMVSNLAWLYLFGNVLQNLIGYRDIVPLYFFACLLSGIIYLILSWTGLQLPGNVYNLGSYPANIAFAIAAITLAPQYRVSLNDQIRFSIWVPFIIYVLLVMMLLIPSQNYTMLLMMGIGAVLGFVYILLLKNGTSIGRLTYKLWDGTNNAFDAQRKEASKRSQTHVLSHHKNDNITAINIILDKINENGITSLTAKEKELLQNWKDKV